MESPSKVPSITPLSNLSNLAVPGRTRFNIMLDSVKNAANTLMFLVTLPVVILWRLLISFFIQQEMEKPWRRVVGDAAYRWFIYSQSIPQMVSLFGSSTRAYNKWCQKNSIEPCIEDIDEDAQILWIGNKRADRVILYLHGGGFSLPLAGFAVKFWRYVQCRLDDLGLEVSIAILDYTLIPSAHFPVPLRQTVAAVNHLLSNGIRPENLQVTGDSAGGNLVIQLLLHMMHPLDGIPSVAPGTQFRGVYLMSPWLFLRPRDGIKSYTENPNRDVLVDKQQFMDFGDRVLAGIRDESALPYVDASYVPLGWYADVEKIVDRVLITAGGVECIRDDIVEFVEKIRKAHNGVELVVDKFGVHDDPFCDFLAGETKLGELTPIIVQWFIDGFSDK